MQIVFSKYQGTGNDFIVLDNRDKQYETLSTKQIQFLCNRHFGIGADGLMCLNTSEEYAFEMRYFNSDGNESTMCGNGGRCITAFAKKLHLIENHAIFRAIDGKHESYLSDNNLVDLKMNDVNKIIIREESFELNTGSPHYVHYIDELKNVDVKKEGGLIRYSPLYKEEGINVNFVEIISANTLFVRTYERGVEDETLSCGTGVTACALTHIHSQIGNHHIWIQTLGGQLEVRCTNKNGQQFDAIWLKGKAEFVFDGNITI